MISLDFSPAFAVYEIRFTLGVAIFNTMQHITIKISNIYDTYISSTKAESEFSAQSISAPFQLAAELPV